MFALFSLVFAAVVLARCPPCSNDCGPADDCTLCKVNGVSRLSRDRCSATCYKEKPNNHIFRHPPCRLNLPTGELNGEIICREDVCPLSSLETRLVREADKHCSRLSPISFSFDSHHHSPCQSYLRNKIGDEGCKKGFKAYCKYPEVSDYLGEQPVISADAVYKLERKDLVEINALPFQSDHQCPPLYKQEAFAAWCLPFPEIWTPVPAAADLASLMIQNFSCPHNSVKRIVNRVVGCYKVKKGPSGACMPGQNAFCFYAVPK